MAVGRDVETTVDEADVRELTRIRLRMRSSPNIDEDIRFLVNYADRLRSRLDAVYAQLETIHVALGADPDLFDVGVNVENDT